MDVDRFVAFVRVLSAKPSRRGAVRLVASSVLGGWLTLSPEPSDARKKGGKRKGKKKRPGAVSPPPPPPRLVCGTGAPCFVFITSTTHDGNLGGVSGADIICQQRATDAARPGTYKAWLSDSVNSPATRFVRSPGPYQLFNGTRIADSYADLTDGSLTNLIDRTEDNDPVASFNVWTHTQTNGTVAAGDGHCHNWSSPDDPAGGDTGAAVLPTSGWTVSNATPCAGPNHLYCFQQS